MNWGKSKELEYKNLRKFLRLANEEDWLEFKAKKKLFNADGKLEVKARDEFIKDILGLANGNSHIIRKTKYLIIGVDDSKFDDSGERVRHLIDYRLPLQSEIAKWLKDACTPAVVGISCSNVEYKDDQLFVITIPPTFDLHETSRELVTPGGNFQKFTVFMRHDEHTVPASVRDGITIQEIKHLHRQEIANPPSILIGALVGGFVAFIIAGAKIEVLRQTVSYSDNLLKSIFTGIGILFGVFTGWNVKQLNEVRYDWRYISWRQRVLLIGFLLIMVIIYLLLPK
jgi:hypothetical protein